MACSNYLSTEDLGQLKRHRLSHSQGDKALVKEEEKKTRKHDLKKDCLVVELLVNDWLQWQRKYEIKRRHTLTINWKNTFVFKISFSLKILYERDSFAALQSKDMKS